MQCTRVAVQCSIECIVREQQCSDCTPCAVLQVKPVPLAIPQFCHSPPTLYPFLLHSGLCFLLYSGFCFLLFFTLLYCFILYYNLLCYLLYYILEDTSRYAGLLLAPAEGFGRGFFCPLGKKRAYYAVLAHFRPFLVSSSNLGKF